MPTVTVDLNAAFVGQRIDFDVPIVVTGTISKDVTSVTLLVRRLDGRKRPKKGQPAPPPCTGATGRTLLTEVSWTRLAGSDATAFSLVLPPLDPNIDLCFEFSVVRGLGPEEKKNLTEAALRATRSAFEDLGENSALGVAKAEALRRAIATAVIDGVKPLRTRFQPGSIFCVDTVVCAEAVPIEVARNQLAALSAPLAGAQRTVFLSVENIRDIRVRAQATLAAWIRSGAGINLVSALETGAASDAGLRATLEPFKVALSFLRSMDPDDAAKIVVGFKPGSGVEPADPDWSGTKYSGQRTEIAATLLHVNAVLRLTREIAASPALQKSTGLTSAELLPLEASLQLIRDNLVSVDDELKLIGNAIATRDTAVGQFAAAVELRAVYDARIFGTSVGDFNTRHAWYVSADLGLGFVPDFDQGFGYFGMNVYTRPVNKAAPLRGLDFRRRFALMMGMTVSGSLEKPGERKGFLGSRMLLAGAGFRFADSLRLSGGALIFNADDPRPNITRDRTSWSPFFALSVDWDVKESFAKMLGITP